jgi:hypothetical protein
MNIVYGVLLNIHLLIPFIINFFSAVCIIKSIAHSRSIVRPEQSIQQHLKIQIQHHRRLLYAPCILILLSLPRLIISFINGCMRSSRESWLYLIGYFIAFIPSMLTFIVFILPSRNYKKEFDMMIQRTIKRFRNNL